MTSWEASVSWCGGPSLERLPPHSLRTASSGTRCESKGQLPQEAFLATGQTVPHTRSPRKAMDALTHCREHGRPCKNTARCRQFGTSRVHKASKTKSASVQIFIPWLYNFRRQGITEVWKLLGANLEMPRFEFVQWGKTEKNVCRVHLLSVWVEEKILPVC